MNDDITITDRGRDLAEFANAAGQPNQPMPSGHAVMRQTTGIPEMAIGAQPVAIYRDEQKVLAKLRSLAAAAGTDWFYRFPVNKKGGGVDYIEGPSIKLANEVHRVFGNLQLQIREFDAGDSWTFYARIHDLEGGSSMERAYRQRKSQATMRTKDADRSLDIAYQIGQSKAIRNVICNFLQIYCDFAFEEARNSLVEKIGKDLPGWRERTLQGLAKMPVEAVRVERVIGRAAKEWLAPNIAQVIAMMKSVADGMASVDEVFPPIEEPIEETKSTAAAGTSSAKVEGGGESEGQTHIPDAGGTAGQSSTAANPIAIAHRRGQEAKAAGEKRAAPEEYRQTSRIKECDAWLAGWDGKPAKEAP